MKIFVNFQFKYVLHKISILYPNALKNCIKEKKELESDLKKIYVAPVEQTVVNIYEKVELIHTKYLLTRFTRN